MIYHQIFLTLIASKSLKLSFTLNCVLKRANDLKQQQQINFINNYQLKEEHAQLAYSIS